MGTGAAAGEKRASSTTSERKLTSHNTGNNNNDTYIIYNIYYASYGQADTGCVSARTTILRSLKTAIFHTGFVTRWHSRPKREETSSRLYLLAPVPRPIYLDEIVVDMRCKTRPDSHAVRVLSRVE